MLGCQAGVSGTHCSHLHCKLFALCLYVKSAVIAWISLYFVLRIGTYCKFDKWKRFHCMSTVLICPLVCTASNITVQPDSIWCVVPGEIIPWCWFAVLPWASIFVSNKPLLSGVFTCQFEILVTVHVLEGWIQRTSIGDFGIWPIRCGCSCRFSSRLRRYATDIPMYCFASRYHLIYLWIWHADFV